MSCVAIILAAGTGNEMESDIPVQFINVCDKPILMYTLDTFEKHPQVDAIAVVSIAGWGDVVKAYAKQYNISKLKWVVTGGETAQESIRNGLFHLKPELNASDIVIIHDGIRPLVDQFVLTDVIKVAAENGNAITSLPYNEQIFVIDENDKTVTKQYIPRETIRRVSTPQAYRADIIMQVYEKAFRDNIGIGETSYADTLMADMGVRLFFSAGSDRNIKISTYDDLSLFKAYLKKENDFWLK
jgi:2-C-methyl-D-erythritol 4-phosphate cytidylyltransferase